MDIAFNDWMNFINRLTDINSRAADDMRAWLNANGGYAKIPTNQVIDYAYGLATKYGEASAALSAQMYDDIAFLSDAAVPPAEVAETATYEETAKAVNGASKFSEDASYLAGVVSRLVKQAGADTTLRNAQRDGAQFAWIPNGDTCIFCLTLASRGWQYMSKAAIRGGHAEHIHANCDCTYAVRFNESTNVRGYDPDKYREMYDNANTDSKGKVSYYRDKNGNLKKHVQTTSDAKINAMRREAYAANKERINAQKRDAYARKKALEDADEINVGGQS